MPTDTESAALERLRAPETIRERAENVFHAAEQDRLEHFALDLAALDGVTERVLSVIERNYPDRAIPYHSRWGHFRAHGEDRLASIEPLLARLDARERARTLFDLVVVSVLLDAGAGAAWRYRESGTRAVLARSEGLAVASFHAFVRGAFSPNKDEPLRADAEGLEQLEEAALAEAFQVSAENPLVGLGGRVELMRALGRALRARSDLFGSDARIGGLVDHLVERANGGGVLPAAEILAAVLDGLSPIWPGRLSLGGVGLGDVWPHPKAGGEGPSAGLVPLHKLSQWLSYSLVEPLEELGFSVVELDRLTGLAEYRNGGLFVDMGVLRPKHEELTRVRHAPGDEPVVEWRALTIALLDRTAARVRERLGVDAQALPLAKVLEGGTWHAGREVALERRSDGAPPIAIVSDGTVF